MDLVAHWVKCASQNKLRFLLLYLSFVSTMRRQKQFKNYYPNAWERAIVIWFHASTDTLHDDCNFMPHKQRRWRSQFLRSLFARARAASTHRQMLANVSAAAVCEWFRLFYPRVFVERTTECVNVCVFVCVFCSLAPFLSLTINKIQTHNSRHAVTHYLVDTMWIVYTTNATASHTRKQRAKKIQRKS